MDAGKAIIPDGRLLNELNGASLRLVPFYRTLRERETVRWSSKNRSSDFVSHMLSY
jgi:hypothetical protein